jgi:molybdenum cofactor cytidylyltransferase
VNLLQALRLGGRERLALVGAGGKTTALFQLAGQYLAGGARRVLLSTTTHLADWQLGLADHHFILTSKEQLKQLNESLPPGVLLFSGPLERNQRVSGLSGDIVGGLVELASSWQTALLVEADGARQRPLKAPAAHEPPIPAWVEQVVVLAGLSGLGKALGEKTVHRPEIFARLSGLEIGAPVTLDGLARLLLDPQGGLKNVPPGARCVALLNQADTPELQAAGAHLALRLLKGDYSAKGSYSAIGGYSASLVASLAGGKQAGDQPEGSVFAAYEPVAGIVLAAGGSSRLGQPKQLLPWRGQPLVRHAATSALQAGLEPVVVVTGAYAEAVQAAVSDLNVQVVFNPDWTRGQSRSLAAGLARLPDGCGAAVFLLADQPHLPVSLLRSLVALHTESLAPIVAPLVDGQRGNPVLFDRQTFSELAALQGDVGGRALFSRYAVTWLPWHDASLLVDIDHPQDLERLQE